MDDMQRVRIVFVFYSLRSPQAVSECLARQLLYCPSEALFSQEK
jgi:hypothetical protein